MAVISCNTSLCLNSGVATSQYGDMTQADEVSNSDGKMGKDESGNGDWENGKLGNGESRPSRQLTSAEEQDQRGRE